MRNIKTFYLIATARPLLSWSSYRKQGSYGCDGQEMHIDHGGNQCVYSDNIVAQSSRQTHGTLRLY